MDLKKYDELRKKINKKNFEGNNSGLDKWLFRFSFIGNASAIFFAYFLVYPALLKTITINFIDGFGGSLVAFILSTLFLTIFEIIKRYFIRNFSDDYFTNRKKVNLQVTGWFVLSLMIIILSFYLSITGSKNLATTSTIKNIGIETQINFYKDSLSTIYENKKKTYINDNEVLRIINNDLRKKLIETPINYTTIRRDYQTSIDKNVNIITENQNEINELNIEFNNKINELKENLIIVKSEYKTEDIKNIFLFIIIVIFNEILIIGGIYFREYYEHKLFEINYQKFEKIYLKKDRYRALLTFIYGNGKLSTGDKVISGLELKELIADKTNIQNSNKIIDEFLRDMDRLNIFITNGKRRFINVIYDEAINTIETFDDAFRVIENMK